MGGIPQTAAFVAPSHYDIGSIATRGTKGTHLEFALSTASASARSKANYDVGLGYEVDMLQPREDIYRRTVPGAPVGETFSGPYIDFARRILGDRHQRVFAGLRTEALWGADGYAGMGVAGRVSWEVFGTVAGAQNHALIYGSYGLGLFAQLSVRSLDAVQTAAIAGVTLRLPVILIGK